MKVFRGIVLGLTIAYFIFAILSLILLSTLEMAKVVIIGALIIIGLNIVSNLMWAISEKFMIEEIKWAGSKFRW